MRTPKELYPSERIICEPEMSACPHCEEPLVMYNYLAWDKTVQTLDRVLSIASRPGHCANPTCPGYRMWLLSAEGQQITLPGSTYGYDVVARIGWLRQEWRDIYAEIRDNLASRVQISESHVRYLYQQVYLPSLACHERRYWDRLARAAQQHGGLIIALDGLAALHQVSPTQLAKEQRRLRQHRERFRLHIRSVRQTKAQFDKLRQQWLSLATTSTE